jgi:hypothetical protein
MAWQPKQILNSAKQLISESDFVWAVHFWFNDVDAAGSRVAPTLQIVEGNQAGDNAI